MTGFRTFVNLAAGPADSGHWRTARPLHWHSMPCGVVTKYTHPHQEEGLTVLAGEVRFNPRRRGTRGPHERDGRCPRRGVPHSERNPGSAQITAVIELRPVLRARDLHQAFAGLVADGRTRPRGHRGTRSSSAREDPVERETVSRPVRSND